MLPSLSREKVSVSWQGTDSDSDLWTRPRRNCRKESSDVEAQRHFENRSPPEWDAIQTHFRCHCFSLQQLIPWITQLRSAARLISCWVINLFPGISDYYLDSTRWVYWWPFLFSNSERNDQCTVSLDEKWHGRRVILHTALPGIQLPHFSQIHSYKSFTWSFYGSKSSPTPKAFSSENHNCSTRHLFPPRSPELMTLFLIWTPPYFPPALRANA